MENVCYTCGSQVAGQSPFCASCGAPQIRVPVREATAENLPQLAPESSQASLQPVAPPPMPVRVGIQWKTFFRIALPLGAVVGVSQVVLPAFALLLLPGSVMVAIQLYQRRQPGLLRPAHGAKMGAFIGFASFGVYAIIFVIKIAGDPAGLRQQMAALVQEAIARNPTPEARQMAEALFSGTGGLVVFVAVGMIFLLGFLLVLGSVSGALATRFFKAKTE